VSKPAKDAFFIYKNILKNFTCTPAGAAPPRKIQFLAQKKNTTPWLLVTHPYLINFVVLF
jgi:hypothetical protein